jgi:rhamnulose-1-phosphate aldolase
MDFIERFQGLREPVENARRVAGHLWDKGWAERNAGNLSLDVTGCIDAPGRLTAQREIPFEHVYPDLADRCFLVTGSGARFRDVARDPAANLCVVHMTADGRTGRMLWSGGETPRFVPTSEFPSHLRTHEMLRRADDAALTVLHTHPTELIALTHHPDYRAQDDLNRALWAIHPEVKVAVPRGLGIVPYTLPGSESLARATVEVFARGYRVVTWVYHGCVAVGTDPDEAFDLIDTLNKAARLVLLCRGAGFAPEGLSEDQLRELASAFGVLG